MKKSDFFSGLVRLFFLHPGKAAGGILGLILGILFLVIGFWRTLLLAFCTLIGYLVGMLYDANFDFEKLFDKILPPGLK